MLRIYQGLLQLYPASYRRRFREEMLWVYQKTEKDLIELPFSSCAGFYAREIAGLLAGAAASTSIICLELMISVRS